MDRRIAVIIWMPASAYKWFVKLLPSLHKIHVKLCWPKTLTSVNVCQAFIGKEKDKNCRRIENIDEVETKMSRITRLPGDRFKVEPSKFPGWLQANSFLKRETELEEVYRKALSSEELSFFL